MSFVTGWLRNVLTNLAVSFFVVLVIVIKRKKIQGKSTGKVENLDGKNITVFPYIQQNIS